MKNNPYKRRKDTREKRPDILIVCEGEETEKNYFESFEVTSAKIKIVPTGENTINIVYCAEKENKKNKYDQVWCVFDKDDYGEKFSEAIEKAKNLNFKVAYSNECFELWFVLHFIYLQSAMSRNDYNKKLKIFLNENYKKNDKKIYDKLLKNQNVAIENAKKLLNYFKDFRPIDANPSTKVVYLVEELNKYKR